MQIGPLRIDVHHHIIPPESAATMPLPLRSSPWRRSRVSRKYDGFDARMRRAIEQTKAYALFPRLI